jgi:hypothetical protein
MRLVLAVAVAASTTTACAHHVADDSATSSSPVVSDVVTMTQSADGTFEVQCKDGRTESKVTADRITSNAVCAYQTTCELRYEQGTTSTSVAKTTDASPGFPQMTHGPSLSGTS